MIVQTLPPGRTRLAATLLILAGTQYAVLEVVTAAAWRRPPYDYAVDFISDLGNPVAGDTFAGRVIDSPLHAAMNTAFVLQGVLVLAGALLLLQTFPAGGTGRALRILAVVHAGGVILVGLFHESSGALTNGVIVVHSVGAAATILAGNIAFVVVGRAWRSLGAPRWYGLVSVGLGVLGLAGFVLLQADRPLYDAAGGVPERIAVYTILLGEIVTGAALLRTRSSAVAATPADAVVAR